MPVFNIHVKEGAFTPLEKKGLAEAMNLALHEAMETPMDDQFILIDEHKEEDFYITPTFPNMQRTDKRMLVNVSFGESRTLEQKRKLAELVTHYAMEKAGVGADDVSMMMYALPLANMTFGQGKLISDIDLSMPWVDKK